MGERRRREEEKEKGICILSAISSLIHDRSKTVLAKFLQPTELQGLV